MAFKFPSKISLAQLPTPLQPLSRLSAMVGGPNLWVKRDDLTEFGPGGNKIRKLEYVVCEALAQGADTLITCGGLQSNHCRATALIAARMGLKCHLLLRGEALSQFEANTFLARLAGASIQCLPLREYQHLDDRFEEAAQAFKVRGHTPFLIPTGASDEIGLWGYIEGACELLTDIRKHLQGPTLVVCATGSGGTHTGLAVGLAESHGPRVRAYAVCDSRDYFVQKAEKDIHSWQVRYSVHAEIRADALDIVDDYIGPGYAKPYQEMLDTIKLVANSEGLVLDPVYTGKAFHGLLEDIKAGQLNQFDNVVFVHTGGVFGVFPYQGDF